MGRGNRGSEEGDKREGGGRGIEDGRGGEGRKLYTEEGMPCAVGVVLCTRLLIN